MYASHEWGARSAITLIASIALLTACFGYNRSAKRWAYIGDTVLPRK
jgi:hypothetical protein